MPWKLNEDEKIYKHVKCCLNGILLSTPNMCLVRQAIEMRCLALSKMAVNASLLCKFVISDLLMGEHNDWPNFKNLTFVQQLFKQGTKSKPRKPTPAIEFT